MLQMDQAARRHPPDDEGSDRASEARHRSHLSTRVREVRRRPATTPSVRHVARPARRCMAPAIVGFWEVDPHARACGGGKMHVGSWDTLAVETVVAAGAFALLGVVVGAFLKERRLSRAATAAANAAREDRLREHDLRRLEETRASLLAQIHLMESIGAGDRARALRYVAVQDDFPRADPRLVGDADAMSAWVEAMTSLTEHIPRGPLAKMTWPLFKSLPYDVRDTIAETKAILLDAFETQERRVLSGEPLVVISREQARDTVKADAIMARMRELFG